MNFVTIIINNIKPNNIYQEFNNYNVKERMKWTLFIKYELTMMIQKNVLSPVLMNDEYLFKRPLVMILVLNIKDNGRYQYFLVYKGFIHREGV